MAKGTVKDPTGHQSIPNGWGYIKRDDLNWPDEDDKPANKKIIPFANPADANGRREFAKNDDVEFDIDYPELNGFSIGVAINVVKVKKTK